MTLGIRLSVTGSKIHYLVSNPGNWYSFLHWLLVKLVKISLLAVFLAKFSTAREIQL